ncbi:hypothetical protein Syun_020695 [Stephania yunnanensis]|uniref:Peptidase metallopeptidase domain-containing protein n=1 Tax=Stephania yunnanensis TaxID=152371 RepID=A0AAP0IF34_9MAGN
MKLKPTQFIIFSTFLLISPITAFKVLSTTNTTQQDGHDQGDYLEKNNQWQYYFKNLSGCGFGDEAQGLAKLKQYFHQFGYIDEGRHGLINNFSDVFDSPLQSALKTYQNNFNLPVSGALDAATLSQLLRPRCGVPDIINGSSTMKSGKPTSANHSSSLHSTAHFSFFPGEPRWPPYKQHLTYAFFPGNNLSEPVKAVFRRAFSRWAAVTPLTFSEADSYLGADMKIGFFVGEHGDGEPFDGVLGTLAHAFSPPDGRFHLDGAEEWAVEGREGWIWSQWRCMRSGICWGWGTRQWRRRSCFRRYRRGGGRWSWRGMMWRGSRSCMGESQRWGGGAGGANESGEGEEQ